MFDFQQVFIRDRMRDKAGKVISNTTPCWSKWGGKYPSDQDFNKLKSDFLRVHSNHIIGSKNLSFDLFVGDHIQIVMAKTVHEGRDSIKIPYHNWDWSEAAIWNDEKKELIHRIYLLKCDNSFKSVSPMYPRKFYECVENKLLKKKICSKLQINKDGKWLSISDRLGGYNAIFEKYPDVFVDDKHYRIERVVTFV